MQVIKPEDHTMLFDSFEKDMNESMSCVLSTDYKRSVDIDGMPVYVDMSCPGESDSNGRLWQPMTVPVQLPLHGIWGLTLDNIFAVGWMGCLLHFDGEQWRSLRGGVIDKNTERFAACEENTPLFAIDGNSQGEAWAVGDNGVILHFDGVNWQHEKSNTDINLRAVLCTDNNIVYAAGAGGTVLMRDAQGLWSNLNNPLSSGFHTLLVLDDGSLLLGGGRYFVDQGAWRVGALQRRRIQSLKV